MSVSASSPRGRLLAFGEACAYLGMKPKRLRRLINTGQIRAIKDGRIGIYEQWADDFVERASTTGKPSARREVRPSTAASRVPVDMKLMRRFERAI